MPWLQLRLVRVTISVLTNSKSSLSIFAVFACLSLPSRPGSSSWWEDTLDTARQKDQINLSPTSAYVSTTVCPSVYSEHSTFKAEKVGAETLDKSCLLLGREGERESSVEVGR